MARPDFRGQAAQRLSEEREELSPAIISLLGDGRRPRKATTRRSATCRVDRIDPNPEPAAADVRRGHRSRSSPRRSPSTASCSPSSSAPVADGRYQLIAGERRWRARPDRRAARASRRIVEDIDDDTALEIAIIENLQREDLSPLDEALMYERMTTEHGYSLRKLAQKLGKDKGYIENRLRLADAPTEIKQLVSLRKDTLSHAYELLKVEDPRKRRKLAEQVARGELSLVKLRERIEGKPGARSPSSSTPRASTIEPRGRGRHWSPSRSSPSDPGRRGRPPGRQGASGRGTRRAVAALRSQDALRGATDIDRQNFAKYLTIAKLKLENAIAVVRSGEPRSGLSGSRDRGDEPDPRGQQRRRQRLGRPPHRATRPPSIGRQAAHPASASTPPAAIARVARHRRR